MRVAVDFDQSLIEGVRFELARWQESAAAGEMDGDEMLSRLGGIAEELDEAIMRLRRALGW
jgi:hypothetical protein